MGVARVQYLPIPRSSVDRYAWRLLGANNRELGRSGLQHADLASCRSAVDDLVARLHLAEVTTTAGHRNSTWTWRLRLDGRTVASASRSYQRQRECEYNLMRFLEALPDAVIP